MLVVLSLSCIFLLCSNWILRCALAGCARCRLGARGGVSRHRPGARVRRGKHSHARSRTAASVASTSESAVASASASSSSAPIGAVVGAAGGAAAGAAAGAAGCGTLELGTAPCPDGGMSTRTPDGCTSTRTTSFALPEPPLPPLAPTRTLHTVEPRPTLQAACGSGIYLTLTTDAEAVLLTGVQLAGDLGHVHVFSERACQPLGAPGGAPIGAVLGAPQVTSLAQGIRGWVGVADRAVRSSFAASAVVPFALAVPLPPFSSRRLYIRATASPTAAVAPPLFPLLGEMVPSGACLTAVDRARLARRRRALTARLPHRTASSRSTAPTASAGSTAAARGEAIGRLATDGTLTIAQAGCHRTERHLLMGEITESADFEVNESMGAFLPVGGLTYRNLGRVARDAPSAPQGDAQRDAQDRGAAMGSRVVLGAHADADCQAALAGAQSRLDERLTTLCGMLVSIEPPNLALIAEWNADADAAARTKEHLKVSPPYLPLRLPRLRQRGGGGSALAPALPSPLAEEGLTETQAEMLALCCSHAACRRLLLRWLDTASQSSGTGVLPLLARLLPALLLARQCARPDEALHALQPHLQPLLAEAKRGGRVEGRTSAELAACDALRALCASLAQPATTADHSASEAQPSASTTSASTTSATTTSASTTSSSTTSAAFATIAALTPAGGDPASPRLPEPMLGRARAATAAALAALVTRLSAYRLSLAGRLSARLAAAEPPPQHVLVLDTFTLIRRFGRGSYGEVFAARKEDTLALFALKFVHAKRVAHRSASQHLAMERKVAERVSGHPFLCGLRYAFRHGPWYVLGFPLMPGGTLQVRLDERCSRSLPACKCSPRRLPVACRCTSTSAARAMRACRSSRCGGWGRSCAWPSRPCTSCITFTATSSLPMCARLIATDCH